MREQILGIIITFIYKFITSTYRYRLVFEDPADRKIFFDDLYHYGPYQGSMLYAFWHQDELCVIPYFANKGIGVLISDSKDGSIMNTLAKLLGYKTVRGSSSRGAVKAFMASVKLVRDGYKLSMAVDGPRGPIYKVKDGLPKLSKKFDKKIVPFRAKPQKALQSERSWNKIRLPYFFSKVDLVVGKIDTYETAWELEEKLKSLDQLSNLHMS